MRRDRFDDLAKAFAADLPRRRLLGAAAAGLASPLLGRAPAEAARCKKPGQGCDKDRDCCGGAECKNDTCKCKNGRQKCGRKCKNLRQDEDNCGRCNNRCERGSACRAGVCIGEGGCRDGADTCGSGQAVGCGGGPSCICVQSVEGGTRCGDAETNEGGLCGQCDSSSDCASLGAGAFCAKAVLGGGCCSGLTEGLNVCILPCSG